MKIAVKKIWTKWPWSTKVTTFGGGLGIQFHQLGTHNPKPQDKWEEGKPGGNGTFNTRQQRPWGGDNGPGHSPECWAWG